MASKNRHIPSQCTLPVHSHIRVRNQGTNVNDQRGEAGSLVGRATEALAYLEERFMVKRLSPPRIKQTTVEHLANIVCIDALPGVADREVTGLSVAPMQLTDLAERAKKAFLALEQASSEEWFSSAPLSPVTAQHLATIDSIDVVLRAI